MGVVRCYAYNCPSSRRYYRTDEPYILFYCLPKHHGRRLLWLRNCGRLEEPSDNKRVLLCQLHFEHQYFNNERNEPEARWRLKSNAIPTLFYEKAPGMPGETVQVQAYVHNGKYFQCDEATMKVTPKNAEKGSKLRDMLQKPKTVLIDDSEQETTVISAPAVQPQPATSNSLVNSVNRALAPKPVADTATEVVNICYLKVDRPNQDTPVVINILNRSQVPQLPLNLKVKIWNEKEPKFVVKAKVVEQDTNHYDHSYMSSGNPTTAAQPPVNFTIPVSSTGNRSSASAISTAPPTVLSVAAPADEPVRVLTCGLDEPPSLAKQLAETRIALQKSRCELRNERHHNDHLKNKLERMKESMKFLAPDQVEAMTRRRTEGMKWSTETMQKGFVLFFGLGNRAYELICDTLKVPLPAIRSMQRVIKNHDPHSDFFNPVFESIQKHKIKGHVTRDEIEPVQVPQMPTETIQLIPTASTEEGIQYEIHPATEEQVAINSIAAIAEVAEGTLQPADIAVAGASTDLTDATNSLVEVRNKSIPKHKRVFGIGTPLKRKLVATPEGTVVKHLRTLTAKRSYKQNSAKGKGGKKPSVKKPKSDRISGALPSNKKKSSTITLKKSLIQEPEVEIHYDWSNAIISQPSQDATGITYVQYAV